MIRAIMGDMIATWRECSLHAWAEREVAVLDAGVVALEVDGAGAGDVAVERAAGAAGVSEGQSEEDVCR